MDALPEDWQAVPNEKEKCEEISRLTVIRFWLSYAYMSHWVIAGDCSHDSATLRH
jgi:hypothetical protein